MKKALKLTALLVIVVFVAIQFIRPDRSTPAIDPDNSLEASTVVPHEVREILARSCYDCHTFDTRYPWYSNVAPFSWLLADHIDEGRSQLNFSIWKSYPPQTQIHNFDEICEVVRAGEMPLPSYLLVHRSAALTEMEKDRLCSWAESESERMH